MILKLVYIITVTTPVKQKAPVRILQKVAKAITINPIIKPSEIQSNAILADLRDRKKWEDVNKTVKSVTNVRKISNEKIKMVKKLQPSSKGFPGVKALQPYLAEKSRFLMYKINENSQYVFKTEKIKFAKSIHRNNNTHMLSEYCFLTVIINV